MKKTLTRIAPVQLGKVAAAIYALFTVIFVPFILLFGILAAFSGDATAAPAFIIIGTVIGAILVPLLYGAMGFIFGSLGALIYNLIATWVGGIDIEVE